MARSEASALKLQAQGVATVQGDLDDAAGLVDTFTGADTLFLLSSAGPDMVEQERRAITAARVTGIRRIVKLSGIGAAVESAGMLQRMHGEAERLLRASGLEWTMLRANGFMQNFPAFYGQAVAQGQPIYAPMGEARVSYVDAGDVGAAAAAVLCEDGHQGRVYELTGPEALSYGQVAELLGKMLDRPVTYVAVPDAAAHQSMLSMGPWFAHALVSLNQLYRTGAAEATTGTVEILTGRPARSLETFLAGQLPAFRA